MVAGAVPKLCGSRSELGAPRNPHCTPASSAWQAGALESWLVCAGRPGVKAIKMYFVLELVRCILKSLEVPCYNTQA